MAVALTRAVGISIIHLIHPQSSLIKPSSLNLINHVCPQKSIRAKNCSGRQIAQLTSSSCLIIKHDLAAPEPDVGARKKRRINKVVVES